MSEWRPIATAPRDGTWVLLIGGETDEDFYLSPKQPECVRRVVSAFWLIDSYYDDGGAWVMTYWDGNWRTGYDSPTHWMPLPVSPA